ncbi:MAG: ion channel [Balneola sp.]
MLHSVFNYGSWYREVINILLVVILLLASSKSLKTVTFIILSGIACLNFLLHWIYLESLTIEVQIISNSLSILFFIVLVYLVLKDLVKEKVVNANVLCEAISIYLILGILWAFIFKLISVVDPVSLSITKSDDLIEYLYFSFSSLTTLGFGDILPVSPLTRTLAYFEAIVGQVYLTILIARLVAINLSNIGK